MESPDSQILTELASSVANSLATHRPLLTHLNADTAWLLSLPLPVPVCTVKRHQSNSQTNPEDSVARLRSRNYFHVLIDPWFRGGQSDVTRYLSEQWHKEESAVQSVEEVLDVIAEIEELAGKGARRVRNGMMKRRSSVSISSSKRDSHDVIPEKDALVKQEGEEDVTVKEDEDDKSMHAQQRRLDLVVISHEFTDHMHKQTLHEVHPDVPVFATSVAAGRIQSWKHFTTVIDMPIFSGKNKDWHDLSRNPLPSWLSVARLVADMSDPLQYHTAVMIAFDKVPESEHIEGTEENEAIVYTPHGIWPQNLEPMASAQPPIRTLALLHGMHDIRLGPQLNLGAFNGLKIQRMSRAKYWIGTHDEVKTGGGLVSWILRRKVVSLEDALKMEIEERGGPEKGDELEKLDDVHFAELKNGESLLLA